MSFRPYGLSGSVREETPKEKMAAPTMEKIAVTSITKFRKCEQTEKMRHLKYQTNIKRE